uniref:Uncharacterized protein n=1 Tax=viral metagenome TaxID=1070528 RepID=A0A6M3L104_9ZZZZ
MNFKLIDKLIIKNPTINIQKTNCYLYNFKEGGFSEKQFTKWLNGKIMDIYEFTGKFGKTTKCPWCGDKFDLLDHLPKHHQKYEENLNTIKLSNQLYALLLSYLRNGNYDALSFFMHKECQYCINPIVKGREGKCSIPSSTRNKPRSIKLLRLKFNGFNTNNYSKNCICIIYKRKPIKIGGQ